MLTYRFLVTFCWLINCLPLAWRVGVFTTGINLALLILPRLKRTAFKNLALALPDRSSAELLSILKESNQRFARGLVDTLRLPTLNAAWVRKHVEFPDAEKVKNVIERAPNKAALFVTGHYNSFEILPRCISEYIHRTGYFVARSLRNPYIDRWWNELRGEQGNAVINRAGGLKKIVDLLKGGDCIGLVFDQNVTRKQAVFVDWFGHLAATTKAMAYCHLRLRVPIVLVIMHQVDAANYRIETHIFECEQCASDESKNNYEDEVALKAITQRVSDAFTAAVKAHPEGWFWLHRRWKTRPNETDVSFYD